MPGKINEARIYALEARLAHEMESRLLFEESHRNQMSSLSTVSNTSPSQASPGARPSMVDGLPALSRHTPRGQTDGLTARSEMSAKARRTGRGSAIANGKKSDAGRHWE